MMDAPEFIRERMSQVPDLLYNISEPAIAKSIPWEIGEIRR